MKHALVISALMIANGYMSSVFANPGVRDAEHMVVVTSTEAIHFKDGGAFFEMKEVLANGVLNENTVEVKGHESKAADLYLIGGGELKELQIGPTWVKSANSVHPLSTEAAARFWHIVESREGTGTNLNRLEQDLEFLVEESR